MDRLRTVSSLFSKNQGELGSLDILDSILYESGRFKPTWHPLGYVFVRLGGDDEKTYRLHVWLSEERRYKTPNWPIHNHVYDLESFVLFGTMVNQTYSVTVDQAGANRLYRVVYTASGSDILRTDDLVRISEKERCTYKAGEHYIVKRGEFHESIVPLGTLTATVVCASNTVDENPIVVGTAATGGDKHLYGASEVCQRTFCKALIAMRDAIQNTA